LQEGPNISQVRYDNQQTRPIALQRRLSENAYLQVVTNVKGINLLRKSKTGAIPDWLTPACKTSHFHLLHTQRYRKNDLNPCPIPELSLTPR
jgi:hypothetical protein